MTRKLGFDINGPLSLASINGLTINSLPLIISATMCLYIIGLISFYNSLFFAPSLSENEIRSFEEEASGTTFELLTTKTTSILQGAVSSTNVTP